MELSNSAESLPHDWIFFLLCTYMSCCFHIPFSFGTSQVKSVQNSQKCFPFLHNSYMWNKMLEALYRQNNQLNWATARIYLTWAWRRTAQYSKCFISPNPEQTLEMRSGEEGLFLCFLPAAGFGCKEIMKKQQQCALSYGRFPSVHSGPAARRQTVGVWRDNHELQTCHDPVKSAVSPWSQSCYLCLLYSHLNPGGVSIVSVRVRWMWLG